MKSIFLAPKGNWRKRIPGSKFIGILIIICLSGMLLQLSFQRHSGERNSYWEKEIFSDKSGYYIYLPSVFLYHFNPEQFPKDVVESSGNGFFFKDGKVITKYPYGVSIFMAPFFLLTHLTALVFNLQADGFSFLYQKMLNVSAIFYLMLGLYFLYRLLILYFRRRYVYIGLAVLLFGTNLLYYATDETGMSHVYTFALFAFLMYYFKKFTLATDPKKQYRLFFLVALAASLIIVVRNINVVFLPFVLFWDISALREIKARFIKILTWKNILTFLVLLLIFLLPQMLYWKYAFGSYFISSYENESFTNLAHPRILELWFAPRNGILLYNPLLVVFVASSIFMILRKQVNGLLILLVFITYTYLYASWWCWFLGAGFSSRAMVDIYPLTVFALIYPISLLNKWYKKIAMYSVLIFFTLYSLNIYTVFKKCFFGLNDWDWYEYNTLVYSGDYATAILGPGFYQEKYDHLITLSTTNNLFVTLNPDGLLAATATVAGERETFKAIRVDSTRIALKTCENRYVCADAGRNEFLTGVPLKRASWELFELVQLPGNKTALLSYKKLYVSADRGINGQLVANRTQAGEWEEFVIDTLQ